MVTILEPELPIEHIEGHQGQRQLIVGSRLEPFYRCETTWAPCRAFRSDSLLDFHDGRHTRAEQHPSCWAERTTAIDTTWDVDTIVGIIRTDFGRAVATAAGWPPWQRSGNISGRNPTR
jgi:hypothetical protein